MDYTLTLKLTLREADLMRRVISEYLETYRDRRTKVEDPKQCDADAVEARRLYEALR
jgi:hypothetical protein